ncbi:hypothetical protein ACPUYX_16795 [Desulfosporosinus sp. SYSU MS00001]|uniref:hypothetical protein n=1 Tax=Desulfosporosinus sp. SYSU MS00001 TaxID=3416284 RepID=UPI003CEAFA3E
MINRSIANEDIFKIEDEDTQNTFYGCNQEWYTTMWQRRAGCGPTVATNIVYYLNCTRKGPRSDKGLWTKRGALLLMEEVYQYVKPTMRGIPTTKLFGDDVLKYAEAMKRNIQLEILDVPKYRKSRPLFQQLLTFLEQALHNNRPVAFLNLDNGEEKRLDSWHWVTIIAMVYAAEDSRAILRILDGGHIKEIDLGQWFQTTALGGGFVSFDYVDEN